VTATVHSKDSTGPMFGIWNIPYKDEADSTEIKFSAQTLQPTGNDFHFLSKPFTQTLRRAPRGAI